MKGILMLGVDEWAITQPTNFYSALGTIGAGQCIILALYQPNQQLALLTHLTSLRSGTEKYQILIRSLRFFDSNTVAYLYGGYQGNEVSKTTANVLCTMLMEKGIVIKQDNTCSNTEGTVALAIDSEGGNVNTNPSLESEFSRNWHFRLFQSLDVNILDKVPTQVEIRPNQEYLKSLEQQSPQPDEEAPIASLCSLQ